MDREFVVQDRKISLIILTCLVQPAINGLNAVELFDLPADMTLKTQPFN